jgi:hypothetical protein
MYTNAAVMGRRRRGDDDGFAAYSTVGGREGLMTSPGFGTRVTGRRVDPGRPGCNPTRRAFCSHGSDPTRPNPRGGGGS